MTYIVFHTCLWGGPRWNEPTTITQPDGTIIECLASGDEYYGRLHDEDGYTIIQNMETGYYCYAIVEEGDLIASEYVVGTVSPKSVNLKPNANLSPEKRRELLENDIMYMTNKFDLLCTHYVNISSDTNKDARKKMVFNEIQKMLFDTKRDVIKNTLFDILKIHFPDTIMQNMFFDTTEINMSECDY